MYGATLTLDTTIPSYLFDERDTLKFQINVTRKWWNEERNNFELWISGEVLNEIKAGNFPKKSEILKFVEEIPVLLPDTNIINIAKVYLENFVMPRVLKGDALHLAYASFYKFDFLLTWNCNHLANANKKQHIHIINTRLNLPVPTIITPLELFSENTNDYQ